MAFSFIITIIVLPIFLLFWGTVIYVLSLVIKALRKYINTKDVRDEKTEIKISLGEALKKRRIENNMTQEFVAENLGVTRQSVSKWENGTTDPSTSNLLALAKLYNISAEELLKNINQ